MLRQSFHEWRLTEGGLRFSTFLFSKTTFEYKQFSMIKEGKFK